MEKFISRIKFTTIGGALYVSIKKFNRNNGGRE
jgi:hypothetical protein